MLVAAAVCPGPPLLVPELSGPDPQAEKLRLACTRAVADLLAAAPDVVAIVGAGPPSGRWPGHGQADLRTYGGFGPHRSDSAVPLSVGLGAWLLDRAGFTDQRLMWTVDTTVAAGPLADEIGRAAGRVGLLVIADGSARRTLKAPGYLDDRAEPYDREIERALSTGDTAALTALPAELAEELMAPGWPALQVLAAGFGPAGAVSTMYYAGAPFGVGYLVASLRPTL